MTVFSIIDPVFKTEPMFIGNCTMHEMNSYLKKKYRVKISDQGKEDECDENISGAVFTFEKSPWRVVWIRKFSLKPEYFAELIHEVFHLVVRICRDKQIPIIANIETGEVGDEAAAYLLEHFIKTAHKQIMKRRNK